MNAAPTPPMRAATITISSSRATGGGHDESGERMLTLLQTLGLDLAGRDLIADDRRLIEARLIHWTDAEGCNLVLTSGGTGVAPTDVTPEATAAVIERPVPGIGEALRYASREHTRHWMLSRGLAGIRGQSLIVNLPGSPAGVTQATGVLLDALPHALRLIAGEADPH